MAINNEFKDEDRWISREEFHRLKDIDPYVAICYSFNYNMKVYAYSPEMEVFKKALYYKMVFNDDSYMTDEVLHWIQTDERDMRKPQNLRALNRIKEIGKDDLSNITVHCGDYRDYNYREGDIVYCDIPYEGTDCRKYKGFDNKEFYEWVASRPYQVFFSSYEIFDDRFFIVWKKKKMLYCSNTAQSGKRGETTEYIYSNMPYKKENKFIFGV